MKKTEPTAFGGKRPGAASNPRPEDTAALAISECRYRRLFESAKDGILILDAESGKVLDVNPFMINLLGYSYEEFVGKAIWDLGFLKDVFENRDNFLELQEKGYIRYENLPLETVEGRNVNVEFVSNVYPEGEKNVIQCNIRDITARKQVENFHEMGREILQLLNVSDDLNDSISGALGILKKRTGFDAVIIRFQDGYDYPYYGQQEFSEGFLRTENTLAECGADGGMCRDSDGDVSLECTCGLVISGRTDPSNPLFTPGGSFWTNDARQLQELSAEADPRNHPRNECIHQGYASAALVPIRNKNRIVGLIQLNDQRKNLLNFEMIEMLEETAMHLGEALMHKQAELRIERISRFTHENPNPVLRVSSQGVLEYANTAAAPLVDSMGTHCGGTVNAEWQARIETVNAAALPINIECDVADQTFDITFAPIAGCDYINLYARDITRQKRAEEEHRKLQEKMTQAQRMESIGRLAGGVAHDFNNMLSIILGHIELALDRAPSSGPFFESLIEIQKATTRSANLVQQLMAFARQQDVQPRILNLNKRTDDMLPMLRQLIGEDIKLIWHPGEALHAIKIDPSQFDQILTNLCLNARDAIDNTGTISLETGNIEIDADYCARHVDTLPGTYVFLAVSDDGAGMDPATLKHIFEPFFTTKEVGKGTGLGLATVYGIAKQNNGFIQAYSEPGYGTIFRVYLPRSEEHDVSRKASSPVSMPPARGETILLVEDNASLRKVYTLYMDGLGYTLLAAETPEEALRLAGLHPDIHLLLTDVVMPGMNGRELAEKIRESNPGIQVLFMSGYTADILADRGVREEHMAFIAKPFTRTELASKLRELLEP